MPDHLHLLVGTDEDNDLLRFVKLYKQKTGFWYKQHAGGALWQRSFYDHKVRSDEALTALAEYVFDNPVAAGLAKNRGEYPLAGSLVWPEPF